MTNSECAAQDCSLADLPTRVRARVLSVEASPRRALAAHGVRPGVILSVDGDAPFRGPRIVRLGRARLAIARAVAQAVRVRAEPDPRGPLAR